MPALRARLKYQVLASHLARSNRSQNHWALRLGLDKGHLSKMVRGQRPFPTSRTRRKLLEGLELDFDDLFELVSESEKGRPVGLRTASKEQVRPAPRPGMNLDPGDAPGMNLALQDLLYGVRTLRRSPAFAVVTLLTLALGIGASTAIFTIVKGVLWEPLPFPDSERIMTLWQANPGAGIERGQVSYANVMDWRSQSDSFDALAVVEPFSMDYLAGVEPRVFPTGLVSEDFFRVWQTPAMLGRVLQAGDFVPGKSGVVVLSHSLWEQRFGSDPTIIGRSLVLDGSPQTVVGVMPSSFNVSFFERPRLIWAPRLPRANDFQLRGAAYLYAAGRLRPGITPAQAMAELVPISARLAREYPRNNTGVEAQLESFEDFLLGQTRPALQLLLGAVGFVLLIACANAANLQLAHNSEKRRSFAIRAALGARRSRLARQILGESLLLSLPAAALGAALALFGVRVLVALGSGIIPRLEGCRVDSSVLLFSLALALATALAFGLLPTLHLTSPDLQGDLQAGGRSLAGSSRGSRIRSALIVAEVALAVVLLTGAGLLLRSFLTLLQEDPGFATENLVGIQVFAWDRNETPQARIQFFQDTLTEISALPDVEGAAVTSAVPFYGASIDEDVTFSIPERPEPEEGNWPFAYLTVAGRAYFSTLKVPLLEGREFSDRDHLASPPVALVNESLAARYWPGESPLGKRILVRYRRPQEREIVGVVRNTKHLGLDGAPRPEIFIPHSQSGSGEMIYIVRTRVGPQQAIPSIKQAIWKVDPLQAPYSVVIIEDLISASVASRRIQLSLLASLGILALLLAAIGIYGVISYLTRLRTKEIGIRRVVGAQSQDVLRLVLSQGVGLSALGLGLGLLAALALSRLLESMLYRIQANDPLTFLAISLVLMIVAALASLIPARRATRIDPLLALRQD